MQEAITAFVSVYCAIAGVYLIYITAKLMQAEKTIAALRDSNSALAYRLQHSERMRHDATGDHAVIKFNGKGAIQNEKEKV